MACAAIKLKPCSPPSITNPKRMSVSRSVLVSALTEIRAQVECIEYYLGGVQYLPPKKQTKEERLAEARAALATATAEMKEAEIEVMRADTKVVAAKAVVQLVKAEPSEAEQKVAFKAMTDAIQTIQMYAIMNGKSLGPTMDALTQRLFGREPDAALKKTNDAIQTIQEYAITNGISLGSTMDAVTERLFSTERVEA